MSKGRRGSWSGHAFGLSIESPFELPGLELGTAPSDRTRPCNLELGSHSRATGGERLSEWSDHDGLTVSIDRFEGGYRFYARGAGVYELSADGSRLTCDPFPGSGWIWRRYLLGQVLPFAAVLQGLEVFHASAVEVQGQAVAFAGLSGAGKSTLAVNVHLAGAGFVTDDVLTLEMRNGDVMAHPGAAAVKVREAAAGLVDHVRLGPVVSRDLHERRYAVATVPQPIPLGSFCLLEPSEDGELQVDPISADPWRLLASTFNLLVLTPDRLRRQLEVCSAIARCGRVCAVTVPRRPDAETAADLMSRLAAVPAAT